MWYAANKSVEKLKKINLDDIDTLGATIDFEQYQQDKMKKFEQNNPVLNLSTTGSAGPKTQMAGGLANGLGKPDDSSSIEQLAGVASGALAGTGAVGIVNQHFQEKKKYSTNYEPFE